MYDTMRDVVKDLVGGDDVDLDALGDLLERIEGRVDELIVLNATRIKGGGDLVEGVRFENRTRREMRKILGLDALGKWPAR